MSVLEGNPEALTDRAADLLRTSDRIQDVIDSLNGIVDDDKSKAVEALHSLANDVRGQLDRIHGRYDGTAKAIRDYAVELTDAHLKAEAAAEELADAKTDAANARDEVDAAQSAIDNAADGADTSSQDGQLSSAQGRLGRADNAVDDAQDKIDQARDDMNEAAEDAIRRIEDAIADTNEGFWDKVGEFFDDLGDFFKDLADWIGEFFAAVIDFLQKLADTITAILEVLLLLAVIVIVAVALGVSLVLAVVVVGVLAAFIAWSIYSDVTAPDPTVTPYDPGWLENETPPTLENVLYGTGEVDSLGGADQSVVKVTKVLGPDGWYYTVTLPSTQEWLSRFGDKGAVNDLDSNLALVLTPALQTQYEAAVLEAIEQAGITPDDHLMLVGFSQGGIMAGHLAAYNSDLGVDAVVVSGAPIDHMPIPDSVDVVSIQHTYDPVPRLDSVVGDGAPDHGNNWTTIQVDAPGSPGPLTTGQIHNADQYAQTFADNLDTINGTHPDLGDYFPQTGGLGSATSYYHWTE